jgi:hypothetical protein
MTVSELKSVVFPLCSHLINRYRLKNSSDDCRSILLEMYFLKGRRLNWLHLKQLATRYAQIKQDASAQ